MPNPIVLDKIVFFADVNFTSIKNKLPGLVVLILSWVEQEIRIAVIRAHLIDPIYIYFASKCKI